MLTTDYKLLDSTSCLLNSFLLCLLLLLPLLLPRPVFAHAKSTSYSTWEIDETRVRVTVRIPWIELQRSLLSPSFPSPDLSVVDSESERELATYLTTHFVLSVNGQPCRVSPSGITAVSSSDRTRVIRAWTLICSMSQGFRLRNDAFFDNAPAHLHFARVRIAGSPPVEKVFSSDDREWELVNSGRKAVHGESRLRDYLWLGITHILSGTDHLVFLFALLLMAESIGQVARLVTGFTVAHSITLALGVLNIVRPASAAVEALIGFSIAIVALENFCLTTGEDTRHWILRFLVIALGGSVIAAAIGLLLVPPVALLGLGIFSVAYLLLLRDITTPNLRWFVAFIFGLVHGFGFAGVIAEMALPSDRVASALFGFNLGVEVGQLGIVLLLWPALRVLLYIRLSGGNFPVILNGAQRSEESPVLLTQIGSAAVLAVGIFWFVTRAVGQL